ncbi:MAG: L-2-amino-thiazoline-4-carboxylic acid hydrolase [Rhodobacteraceae bacterium]|nr:L-2-amino-thiazoline-4-carboxylic acid hydrolase [Paracoccaceae bacterium]
MIPMIEKRHIEAELVRDFYEVLLKSISKDAAQEIIREAIASSAIRQGQALAAELDTPPGLQDFERQSAPWYANNALEREMLHSAPERLDYNITRCEYAAMYKEMGLGEIGHLLSCNRDAAFCVGYSEDMELTRTQTIMEGASHCDFRYRMKG